MEELYWKRILYYIFAILNVFCLIFGHVTSATTNSAGELEKSQIQTTTPIALSLTTILPFYTTSTAFQPTSNVVLPESYIPQASSDALPQSSEKSTLRPSKTISEIASLNTNLNNQVSQSPLGDSESVMSTSESLVFPQERSGESSGKHVLATQSFAVLDLMSSVKDEISSNIVPTTSVIDVISSNIVPTSSVKDEISSNIVPTTSVIDVISSNIVPTPSVIGVISSNIVPTSSVIDVISSNIVPTSSVIDVISSNIVPTSSVIDVISSNIVPASSVIDVISNILPTPSLIDVKSSMVGLMSSEIVPTTSMADLISSDIVLIQSIDITPTDLQSNVESMQSDLAPTQSDIESTFSDVSFSPSISQFSPTFVISSSVSDFVPDIDTPIESETVSNEISIFETISDLSVTDLNSVASMIIGSEVVSDFNSAFFSSNTDTVLSTTELSYVDSNILDTSFSYVSTELLESQTSDLLQSEFPTSDSSEILFPVSSHGPEEITSSLATHFLSLSSRIIESSTSIEIPESTYLVISPSSILAVPSVSSSTLVNETLPVPEKNMSGLTKGGKVALGICIPIIIILVIAAIVFFAYRRRYHSATWKLTDVVSYRPWSYSNATYYDDESTLIVTGLDK